MSLLERLEAKRREVDRWCRDSFDHRDYLWMCELRDLLDQIAASAQVPVMAFDAFAIDPEWLKSPGYIVYADRNQ